MSHSKVPNLNICVEVISSCREVMAIAILKVRAKNCQKLVKYRLFLNFTIKQSFSATLTIRGGAINEGYHSSRGIGHTAISHHRGRLEAVGPSL